MSSTEDKVEILETISRYSHGADGTVAEDYAGVFTEDGVFKGRSGQPDEIVVNGHEQIKAFHRTVVAGRGNRRARHNQSTTIFLELNPEKALTRTYLMVTVVQEGRPPSVVLTSIYQDEFVRTEKGWRMKYRQILPDVKGVLKELQK